MANTSAAKKAMRQSAGRYRHNRAMMNTLKMSMKKMKRMVAAGSASEAAAELPKIFSMIDKAAKKNLFHKNNAARKKSAMAQLVAKK